MYAERLKRTLPEVQQRVARARERAGRPEAVRIIAVTKGHPVDAVRAALAAGLRDVGENRVQELESKHEELIGEDVTWHLIGHLQRNKAKRAVQLFDHIHSIDSVRLARELSKEAQEAGIVVRGLVQVNVSGEDTKGGFDASRATAEIADVAGLPGLSCEGLMTMAPLTDDESIVRATFAGAKALLDRCVREGVGLRGSELSMGMSGDYEIAIEEGSTMLRLGTVLFGERTK